MHRRLTALCPGAVALALMAAPASPQEQTMAPVAFTAAQALRGEQFYATHCSGCHGIALEGSDAPPLTGPSFRLWRRGPASSLFLFIRTQMPAMAPATLRPQAYADILAFLLARNGYASGTVELPTDSAALGDLWLRP